MLSDYQYEGQKPDTYDNWADSIHRKYHEKKYQSYAGQSSNRKRHSSQHTSEDSRKRPKISDEKQQEFARKLQEEYRKMKELGQMKSAEGRAKARTKYDDRCKLIFSGKMKNKLKFTDIPWPHEEGSDLSSMSDFLFCHMEKGSKTYKKYLKEQQVRWHPDRFMQKCGAHICEKYKERILSKVVEVSQMLNSLTEDTA